MSVGSWWNRAYAWFKQGGMRKKQKREAAKYSERGETIIEVTIAIAIFCGISALTVHLMDKNLATIQATLELNMARNEMDAQAEALRFIHNSFLSDRELVLSKDQSYQNLWHSLTTSLANNPAHLAEFNQLDCNQAYEGDKSIFKNKAFVINARSINQADVNGTIVASTALAETGLTDRSRLFVPATLYPRVIFTDGTANSADKLQESSSDQDAATFNKIQRVEGLWVVIARDVTDVPDYQLLSDTELAKYTPHFYDFHIRTCWNAPGRNVPTTLATIVRLYNPEFIEVAE